MEKINPTVEMVKQAEFLNQGPILIVYKDDNAIRMETDTGNDPYIWRGGKWCRMRLS